MVLEAKFDNDYFLLLVGIRLKKIWANRRRDSLFCKFSCPCLTFLVVFLSLDQSEEKIVWRQRKLRPKSDKDMKIYKKDSQNYKQNTSKLRGGQKKLKMGGFYEKLYIPGSMKSNFLFAYIDFSSPPMFPFNRAY